MPRCLCLLLFLEPHVTARQTASSQAQHATTDATDQAATPRPRTKATKATKAASTKAKTNGQTQAQAAGTTAKAYQQRKARAHTKAEATRQAAEAKMQAFAMCNPHAAAVDIGQSSHWVCVGYAEDNSDLIREFPAHSDGLRQLVAYLRAHQVTTVAMESTGVYWIPLFELLLQEGFQAILVPPQYTRQVQGRPKTDKRDCQWIYRLHSVGLLPAAFRPEPDIAVLRAYLRERANVVRDAAKNVQRMQKALEQMNLKLTTVVDDVTGLTGQKIIQAILKGTRDPLKLAQLRHPKCQADAKQFALALDGTYRDEHLFALRQAYDTWHFYQKQLDKVDEVLAKQLERMKQSSPLQPLAKDKRRGGHKANDLRFDARQALYYVVGVDLTELEGVGAYGVDADQRGRHGSVGVRDCEALLLVVGSVSELQEDRRQSEVVTDTSWPVSSGQGAASGGQQSALEQGCLGSLPERLKGRLGMPAAVTATAHKLARLIYYALTRGMTYVRQTQEQYETQYRARQIQQLKKKARALGLEIKEQATPEQPAENTMPG